MHRDKTITISVLALVLLSTLAWFVVNKVAEDNPVPEENQETLQKVEKERLKGVD